ncbi:MAG: AtpZ/AtpI family protein [Chitinophagales bacterium]|nr:AtpZ/AtpI family protein [Chitinophagales bacterium]
MPNKKDHKIYEKSREYLKYSGLAFQFAAVVLVGYFIGSWLDQRLQFDKPIMTMLLILVLFSGYMYKLYVELSKKP